MKITKILPAILAGILIVGPAHAQTNLLSKTYSQCIENANSAEDAFACGEKEEKRLNKQMNIAYKKVEKQLDASDKKLLKQSQTAWKNYHLAHCEVVQAIVMGDTTWHSCLMESQAKRILELNEILNNN